MAIYMYAFPKLGFGEMKVACSSSLRMTVTGRVCVIK